MIKIWIESASAFSLSALQPLLRVYRFTFRRFVLPFLTPMRTAHGLWREREGVWVKLVNESGDAGLGEAAPIPAFGTETLEQLEERCRALNDPLTAEEIDTLGDEWPCLQFALRSAQREVEMSRSKRTGESTLRDAGSGSNIAERTLNPYLPVAALLPAGKAAFERIAVFGDAGFRTFKWKVGVGDLADELSLAEDLLGKLPPGAKLRLDANGAWNHRQAQKWLERAADWPIEFLEQPIAPDARGFEDTMLGLAADYPTPLALDESIATGAHVTRWIELGWRGFFVIKPALLGNVEVTLTRIQKATTNFVFSSALETAVGAKRTLQIALDHGEAGRAIGFGVWPLFADPRLNGPTLAPFLRREDVERLDVNAAWKVLGE
ncbi:MAG TPA: o-succinylbenzoate synthase [Opitutaceae bacterium]